MVGSPAGDDGDSDCDGVSDSAGDGEAFCRGFDAGADGSRDAVPVPVSFDNIQEVVKIPDYREQLSRNLDQMVHLSVRCFPAYRQIIIRYCQLMMQVQKGRSAKEAVQELGPLIEYREAFVSASTRARDYLDWLEITYLGGKSGTFSSYMSTMDLLRKGKEETPTKMSRYLDDIEALHLLPADAPTPPSIRSLLSRDEQR